MAEVDDGFPAEHFELGGTPNSISTSGGKYSSFGTSATTASGHIRSLDTSLFIGPEADKYREGLNSDLPPHLDTTGTAYTMVGGALSTFSTALSGYQERMSPLRTQAPGLWQALQNAKTALATAKTNDSNHATARSQAAANLKDGQKLPADTYHSQAGSASSSLSSAQQAWDTCYNSATTIKTEHTSAVDTCVTTIGNASGMRFHKNPSGWGAFTAGFKSFVSDHVGALMKISSVLKTISAVAGVLSFIPVVGEIAAPIAIITGVAALAIDASVKYATGKGSWKSIIIDGALIALPGAGKLGSKFVTVIRDARGAEEAAAIARTGPRAQELQSLLGTGGRYKTMAVGVGKDAAGNVRTVIGSSERGGYLRPAVRSAMQDGEEAAKVPGKMHAETRVLQYMEKNGISPSAVGAGRPVCSGCENALKNAGTDATTPLKSAISRPSRVGK